MILKCNKSEISIENETSLVSKLEDFFKLESVIRLEKSNGSFVAVTPTGDDTFTFEYKENDRAFLCLDFYNKEIVTEVFTKFFRNEEGWNNGSEWEEVTGSSIWPLIIFAVLLSSGLAFYGFSIGQFKQYGMISGGIILILVVSIFIAKDPKSNGFALSFMKNMVDEKKAESQE